MSTIEITRPTTRPTGATLRVTVLGVVSPLAEGDAIRELIERVGAEVEELPSRGDVARRYDVHCGDERQPEAVRTQLAARDRDGHVIVEEIADPDPVPRPTAVDEMAWAHLPGTLRTQLLETARPGRGTSSTAFGSSGSL